jgi:hypothetical protein
MSGLIRLTGAFSSLTGAVATGAGKVFTPQTSSVTLLVQGITTATVVLQVSMDNTTFTTIGAGVTADGAIIIDTPYKYVRANVTAWTSGTINAFFFE